MDSLASTEYDESTQAYFSALLDEMDHVRPHLRYDIGTEMLAVTEPILTSIAAGTTTPEAGMQQMQEELTEVVREASYPMSDE